MSRPPRRVFVVTALDLGRHGAGALHVHAVASGLGSLGLEVTVFALPGEPLACDPAGAYEVVRVGLPRLLPNGVRSLALVVPLLRRLDRRPTAVYVRSATFTAPLVALLRAHPSVDCVVTEHNGWIEDELRALGTRMPFPTIAAGSQRLELRWSHAARAVTPRLAERLVAEGAARERVFCAVNGTDLGRMHPMDRGAARAALGLDPVQPLVGFIGNLAPWQGVHLLVEAVGRLRSEGRDVGLVVAGDGAERAPLVELARRLGVLDHTTFLGRVPLDRANVVVNAFDVAALPATRARNEAIGLSPLKIRDYAAAGRPVVAAALPGVRELGGAGWVRLHEPDDVTSLAAAIAFVLDDEQRAERMGQQARRYAEEHFGWEETVTAIADRLR